MPIHVRWQHPAHRGRLLETNLGGRGSGEHGSAVVSAGIGAKESRAARVEHVEGDVVGIRPDAHLGIIIEVGIGELVTIVGAGSVGSSRDSDALEKWTKSSVRITNYELREHPTVSELVVKHDG